MFFISVSGKVLLFFTFILGKFLPTIFYHYLDKLLVICTQHWLHRSPVDRLIAAENARVADRRVSIVKTPESKSPRTVLPASETRLRYSRGHVTDGVGEWRTARRERKAKNGAVRGTSRCQSSRRRRFVRIRKNNENDERARLGNSDVVNTLRVNAV